MSDGRLTQQDILALLGKSHGLTWSLRNAWTWSALVPPSQACGMKSLEGEETQRDDQNGMKRIEKKDRQIDRWIEISYSSRRKLRIQGKDTDFNERVFSHDEDPDSQGQWQDRRTESGCDRHQWLESEIIKKKDQLLPLIPPSSTSTLHKIVTHS